MDELARLSLDEFLNRLADRTPTPGGGSVAATSGACACALARMVTAYSIGKNADPKTRATLEEAAVSLRGLDELMRALITQDARAYEEITSAAKSMKTNELNEIRETFQQALMAGAAIPMEIAAIASRLLAMLDGLRDRLNARLLSDLGVVAVLAEASATAAGFMVQTNLSDIVDHAVKSRIARELDAILGHCRESRRNIESFVRSTLETT
ncbi:MAG: cyclodeaminase/cyclohydrolase family protein [Planctomycetes bacterium]|nr:cyclodeaminase/cyclohydrolase family protein [Planctomycetota bacterium]MBI3834652.1 cyclodeaminase/cyclohydrolase family protein [Planctomycetota bacterium]